MEPSHSPWLEIYTFSPELRVFGFTKLESVPTAAAESWKKWAV